MAVTVVHREVWACVAQRFPACPGRCGRFEACALWVEVVAGRAVGVEEGEGLHGYAQWWAYRAEESRCSVAQVEGAWWRSTAQNLGHPVQGEAGQANRRLEGGAAGQDGLTQVCAHPNAYHHGR